MNKCGLSDLEVQQLREILSRYPAVTSAFVFGSRAKGTARPQSDVDIAVTGAVDMLMVQQLQMDFDELPLPYTFDVVAVERLTSPDLLEHIRRVGKVFYRHERQA